MTRVLLFDGPKGSKRFELLRTALVQGGDGKNERTMVTIRREARLLDALDTISAPQPTEQDPEARVLLNGPEPHALTLAQEDFDLLAQYADKAPWTPRAARHAVDLWDWLSTAEKRE